MSQDIIASIKELKTIHATFLAGTGLIMVVLYFAFAPEITASIFDGFDMLTIVGIMIGLINLCLSLLLIPTEKR